MINPHGDNFTTVFDGHAWHGPDLPTHVLLAMGMYGIIQEGRDNG